MQIEEEGVPSHGRRERIITLVERYPALEPDELSELLRWFRKEASAMDVGLIASDDRVATNYAHIKDDHLSGLGSRDVLWATLIVGSGLVALASLFWLAV